MIAESKPKTHRHRSGVRRRRRTGATLVVSKAAAAIGRRVAIHVGDHQYDVARQVIDNAEREYRQAKFRPKRTKDVLLDHMDLPEEIRAKLYDHRFRTLADILAASDEELLAIRHLGPGRVRLIRWQAGRWVAAIAENLPSQ